MITAPITTAPPAVLVEIVSQLSLKDASALKCTDHFWQELFSEWVFIEPVVRRNPTLFILTSEELKGTYVLREIAKKTARLLIHLGPEFRRDAGSLLSDIERDPEAFKHASEELQDNLAVARAAVGSRLYDRKRLDNLKYASSRVQRLLIAEKGVYLYYASDSVKDEEATVRSAVINDPRAFPYASLRLKFDNTPFIIDLVTAQPDLFPLLDSIVRDNHAVLLAALAQNGMLLKYTNHFNQNNPEIILAAMDQNPKALCYAGPSWKYNPQRLEQFRELKNNLPRLLESEEA